MQQKTISPPETSVRSLSQLLLDLKHRFSQEDALRSEPNTVGDTVSIGNLLEAFHERGFGFFLFLFALPMALPLPVPPGINILLASPLLLMTAQQALGRHTIWLPEKMKQKGFGTEKLLRMIDTALPWTQRLEMFVRPRLGFITQGLFSNIIGLLGFVMALSVCVPVPLTNTLPSLGIALMAIGVLVRDGLAVIAGAVIGTAWVIMLVAVTIFFGAEGIEIAKEAIKSLF